MVRIMVASDIQARFDQLRSLTLGTIRATASRPSPPSIRPVLGITSMRLIIALEGRKHEIFGTGDSVEDWVMMPGDVLVVRDDTWLIPRFDSAHRHFGFITEAERASGAWNRCDAHGQRSAEAHLDAPMPTRSALRQVAESLCAFEVQNDQHCAKLLVMALVRLWCAAAGSVPQEPSKAQRTWRQILRYITDHAERPLNRAETAHHLGISENYLSRVCSLRGGATFIDIITDIRLQRAAALLRAVDLSIADVARTSGFADAGYFIRRFRQAYGQTPGQYRRTQRSGDT